MIRELGRGGMSTVFLARDLKHDRDVALKVLRPDLASAVGSERFLRELVAEIRIEADIEVLLKDPDEKVAEVGRILAGLESALGSCGVTVLGKATADEPEDQGRSDCGCYA